ncbi:Uncharacterised protein [Klebsiella pneumoniae]|nr:hypothetical protein SL19_02727 [Klebsiella pneumoniae]OUH67679.1 hypothetical protein AZ029_002920 [Klebsiella pneumoniae]SVZ67287.1 Uncharacterised protein [Klebsiella pneumoniae]SVZ97529.1 Uncharacterised protein [Klebsiella pneumoniae]SWA15883.1 Uncharacterised protein [Klebsiella pneumoniae]
MRSGSAISSSPSAARILINRNHSAFIATTVLRSNAGSKAPLSPSLRSVGSLRWIRIEVTDSASVLRSASRAKPPRTSSGIRFKYQLVALHAATYDESKEPLFVPERFSAILNIPGSRTAAFSVGNRSTDSSSLATSEFSSPSASTAAISAKSSSSVAVALRKSTKRRSDISPTDVCSSK